ncbi:MAG: hypothetical protein IKA99_05925 [Clostridia bacterium]|nr:hypothetical protein [Clostridia bacterium]
MLGNGEKLVRSWDYATSTVKKGLSKTTTSQTLTVTNKRLISEARSERKVSRNEIPLDEIKRIELSREVGSNIASIIFFILAGLMFVLGIVVNDGESLVPFLIGAVLFVVIGILLLGKGSLSVIVYSKDKYCVALLAGASALRARAKAGKMKIKVNTVVAAEIVDQLGAFVFGGGVAPAPVYSAAPEAPASHAEIL